MQRNMRLLAALTALAGGILAIANYRRMQPRRFVFQGTSYLRHPDGSFTSLEGAPVISPQLEAVQAYWDASIVRIR